MILDMFRKKRQSVEGKYYTVAGQDYHMPFISPDQLDGLVKVLEDANAKLSEGRKAILRRLMDAELLSHAVAVVLIPVSVQTIEQRIQHLKGRDIKKQAEAVRYGMSADVMFEVINDFFTITLTSSSIKMLIARLEQMEKNAQMWSTWFAFLLMATSPKENRSDTQQTSGM
jgi:hypothetical protein